VISRGEKDVYLGSEKILDEAQVNLILLLAVLAEAMGESPAFDPERAPFQAPYLAGLVNTALGRRGPKSSGSKAPVNDVVQPRDIHQSAGPAHQDLTSQIAEDQKSLA
jgi:hypothetical protein